MNHVSINSHKDLKEEVFEINQALRTHRKLIHSIIQRKAPDPLVCTLRQVNILLERLQDLRMAYFSFKEMVNAFLPDDPLHTVPTVPAANEWDRVALKLDPKKAEEQFDIGFGAEKFQKTMKITEKFRPSMDYRVFCGKKHLRRFICMIDEIILDLCRDILKFENSEQVLTTPRYLVAFRQEENWKSPAWRKWFDVHGIFLKTPLEIQIWSPRGMELEREIKQGMTSILDAEE